MAILTLTAAGADALDYSTTNSGALTHFWAACESSNRPVTVVSFGDSMADSYRSPTCHLMLKLIAQCGSAGYSLNNFGNTALLNTTNGAAVRTYDYFWFTYYTQVPAGGAAWWENQPTPGGILCDRAGIFYISQTNGGAFRMLISTNGGPWTTALQLNGYSLAPQGHFTNVTVPLNRYRVRVETDAGTNFIIGPSMVATHTGGVHVVFMDFPGIDLGTVTNVPPAIREPILAGLQPDLLVWHMKEPLTGLSSRLEACEHWWSNAAPNCDIIYIGTPWVYSDTYATGTLDQNTLVRSFALKYARTYADLMQPSISYDWLLTHGYMVDLNHLNSTGGLFCANVMWDDLGWFALRLDRRLTQTWNGNQVQLSYHTATGAVYRLEASTDLQTWSVALTNPVAAATVTTNFPPPTGPLFHRLGLSPR